MKQYLMIACFVVCFLLYGCSTVVSTENGEKLDFTVVAEEDIPEEFLKLIEEKKVGSFKMTYSDGSMLYIAVGYGEQKTGGYSIEVPSLTVTESSIIIDTNLLGPEGDAIAQKSYPYVVVKTEYRDLPVTFE
ncbi:MAG: protease complex subunit PrcB family protein [Lachnospiraceae bacterium]